MLVTLSCFGVIAAAAYVAAVMLLVDWYRHTRHVGFIWLGMSAVVWPGVAWLTTLERLRLAGGLAQGAAAAFLLLIALLSRFQNSEHRSRV